MEYIYIKKAKSEIENFKTLTIKIKILIFVYFFVCELNKIFHNLCICLLCIVCVFFEVQIVEMA
jgi:hypothetical protein